MDEVFKYLIGETDRCWDCMDESSEAVPTEELILAVISATPDMVAGDDRYQIGFPYLIRLCKRHAKERGVI